MTEADRLQQFANVPRGLAELVTIEAERAGFTIKQLRSNNTERQRVETRRRVAAMARLKGFSFPQIGRALNRDHSTIIYLLRKVVR